MIGYRTSIRTRLSIQLFGLVVFVLLLTAGAIVIAQVSQYRRQFTTHLATLAEVMGDNSAVGLNYLDSQSVTHVLASLKNEPSVIAAAVYQGSDTKQLGNPFASYSTDGDLPADGPSISNFPTEAVDGVEFRAEIVEVFQPIMQDNERIGTVYLRATTQELQDQLDQVIGIVSFILVGCLLLALAAAFIMRRSISAPILKLADATRRVSEEPEYSLRLESPSKDEIGQLYAGFNTMLSRIREREHELRDARDTLEERVEQRTRELNHRNAELARSNEELQQFAYVSSHDLQEPLRKVQAFGNLLAERFRETLGDEGVDYLDRMSAAATRMRTLINDLLTYSRVASRGRPFTDVDPNEVVVGVLSDLETRIDETSGTVNIGELPLLRADGTQMQQLLQNLIGNALKYHKADVKPVVDVSAEISVNGKEGLSRIKPDDRVWRLTVKDNGIGFDQKYADRIFAPFQRLHGRGKFEGTGMGLAVCRKIVDRHSGAITAVSSPGEGSTFVVTLPLEQPEPEDHDDDQ